MEKFYFELPSLKRKDEALEYLKEHVDNGSKINGSGGLNRCKNKMSYEEWIDDVTKTMDKNYAENMGLVPATTFFTIRENDNKIIGMINFRHYLNDELYRAGGHIGYGIRPLERGKGYAKIQLYMSLLEAEKLGLDNVMVDCETTNEPSDRTIKALGGVLDRVEYDEEYGRKLNVYWIDVKESLSKYKDRYLKYVDLEKCDSIINK